LKAIALAPLAGAVVKVTMPVVISTDQLVACASPPIATVTVPETGLAMVRFQLCAPEA